MPLETLRPDVLREIEQERAERHRKQAEDRTDSRIKHLDTRLRRLENNPAPASILNESFVKELGATIREYVERRLAEASGRQKNANEALQNQIKFLMEQPSLEYFGVYEHGQNYKRNSLVTHEGSLWIAKSNTGSAPGNPGGSQWKMCVKRGRDGKDGKDARSGS